jgi:hypothetical protein
MCLLVDVVKEILIAVTRGERLRIGSGETGAIGCSVVLRTTS